MTILIIAAHPDDEILGCGGTISRFVHEGERAIAIILGEGITSRYDHKDSSVQKEILNLHKMAEESSRIIGIEKTVWHNLPDNKFDTVPLLSIIKIIENEIETFQPEIIFTHHGGDLNIDHSLVFRAVLTATRPQQNTPVKDIFCFEIPSSTEWTFQSLDPLWKPNVFFNISETLDIKLSALKPYASEMRELPHPRSYENVRNNAFRWGAAIGTNAAEAFQLVRSIK